MSITIPSDSDRPEVGDVTGRLSSTVLFTGACRRSDLVMAYAELAATCDEIGFQNGMTVQEWCPSPAWALLALARAAQPPTARSPADWSMLEISELIADILIHHHRPQRNEVRRLGILAESIEARQSDLDNLGLVGAVHSLAIGITDHLDHEEAVFFPRCLAYETANHTMTNPEPHLLDGSTGIHAMMLGHDEDGGAMVQVLTMIDAAISRVEDTDLAAMRFTLTAMAADHQMHAAKESEFLMPAALFAEDKLRTRQRHKRAVREGH